MIVLYHQLNTPIDFCYRLNLNLKSLIIKLTNYYWWRKKSNFGGEFNLEPSNNLLFRICYKYVVDITLS